eukprot:365965-Chlamydomonas_euryale.AAC.19
MAHVCRTVCLHGVRACSLASKGGCNHGQPMHALSRSRCECQCILFAGLFRLLDELHVLCMLGHSIRMLARSICWATLVRHRKPVGCQAPVIRCAQSAACFLSPRLPAGRLSGADCQGDQPVVLSSPCHAVRLAHGTQSASNGHCTCRAAQAQERQEQLTEHNNGVYFSATLQAVPLDEAAVASRGIRRASDKVCDMSVNVL